MVTRRAAISRTALTAALATAGTFMGAGYATAFEPYRVQIATYRVSPQGWPPGLQLRVAILSDFHAHPRCMGEAELAAVVATTNALEPDLTVLLGDYGSQSAGPVPIETVARILGGLKAPRGVFAIQGNHDWGDDREARRLGRGPTRAERALREAGLTFIENAAVRLDLPVPLWLAGLESEVTPGAPSNPEPFDQHRLSMLTRVLDPVPTGDPVILLAHEPDIFALDLDPRVVLTLSGHTHGGQIRIFGWSPWIPSRYGLRYAYGHIVERGRDLVVSAGLGSHFLAGRPVRLGVPPEIVVVALGPETGVSS